MSAKNTNFHFRVRMLCEGAMMVALAQVLSYIKLMELPNGGSLTPAMFPIILFAVRWGLTPGLMAGFTFGLLQLIFDGAYAWGWQSMLLDYLVAFTPLGLAGLFKGKKWGIFVGTVVGCLGRFVVHYISGVTIYKILAPTEFMKWTFTSPSAYSLVYNGSYMLPNTIIALVIAAVLARALQVIAPVLGPDFDIEITETHHSQKADAPSGTAKLLLEAVDPQHRLRPVYGREGNCGRREKDEVGIHALRGGTVAGTHTVHFFGPDEELELTHRNKIGEVGYNLKGIATVTRQKYMTASEKGPWANSYDRWRNDNLTNRYQGVQFGYTSAGRYTSWNDIWNYYGFKERDVLPGDYKYEDWNGDGEINGQDEHPFAFDQTPWLQFSLNAGLQWKNFDFNMLLQGSALGSMEYKEPLHEIWGKNGGGALTQFLDRWHPVDPQADPYDPSAVWTSGHYAYTGRWARTNSAFNRVSTAYLRLKSIELGYTFPKLKQIPNASLRVYANAYNLLTFTGVKFVDPEHPDDDLGRMYPLNKTYTLGVSLSF